MSTLIKLLSIISLTLIITACNSSESSSSTKQPNTTKQSTVTDTLILSSINSEGYHFQSITNNTGAFIPLSEGKQYKVSTLKQGSTVTMTFNDQDDILKVSPANNSHIITEPFKVTSINNHQYIAASTTNSADKPQLYFTTDNIEGNKHININDHITGYYVEAGKEDIFFKVIKDNQPKTVSQTYTITIVNDNTKGNDEYHGSSLNPNDNIFFTSDYIQSIGQLKAGDTIAAYYDKVTDELLYVSKVNE